MWARVTTPEGINHELAPWLRMTAPEALVRLRADDVPLGVRLCRSWILLGGVLPVDYDDLTLVGVEAGRGFHERSAMATASLWEHRRSLHDDRHGGCVLVDRLAYVPRFAMAAAVLDAIVPRLFTQRHRRLRAYFGGEATTVLDDGAG